jgi:hypothetical protein
VNPDHLTEVVHGLLGRSAPAGGGEWETLAGWQASLRVAVDAVGSLDDEADRFPAIPADLVRETVENLYRLYLMVQDEMPDHCDGCGWGLEKGDGTFGLLNGEEPVRWCWCCAEQDYLVDRDTFTRALRGDL